MLYHSLHVSLAGVLKKLIWSKLKIYFLETGSYCVVQAALEFEILLPQTTRQGLQPCTTTAGSLEAFSLQTQETGLDYQPSSIAYAIFDVTILNIQLHLTKLNSLTPESHYNVFRYNLKYSLRCDHVQSSCCFFQAGSHYVVYRDLPSCASPQMFG